MLRPGKGGRKNLTYSGRRRGSAQLGSKVLLIDGDRGLRNLDIVLGMSDHAVYLFADVAGGAVPPGGCHGVIRI